jgi:large subunit ribosomal protein L10
MTKAQKSEIVDYLTGEFKNSGAIVVANYKGSSHKSLETLRQNANEADVKVQVAKNTLAAVALKNAELPELELTQESIFIWAEDQIAACKLADKFASDNKDSFVIKTGIIEGETADIAKINAFAKLPGREELLGMLASVWMGPIRNFTIGLDALRIKKEEEAA